MGLFDKLFGGGKAKQGQIAVAEVVDCPHALMVPRWESVKDMGHEDRATRYMCEACHKEFTPEEAKQVAATIAERMAASLEEVRAASEAAEADSKKNT